MINKRADKVINALRIVIYRQRQRLEDIGCIFKKPLPKRFRELQRNDYNHY
jgi:hypothetical protein